MGIWAWFKRLLGISSAPRRASLTGADVLQRVQDLQKANAQWPEIWQALNPDGNQSVQKLLIEFRGPHMFAPHVALNVLEDSCRRVLARDANADRLAVLQAALKSGDPFVRPD